MNNAKENSNNKMAFSTNDLVRSYDKLINQLEDFLEEVGQPAHTYIYSCL